MAMTYAERVAQIESSGNPNARAKTSSATGLYQFIESTWIDTVSQYEPELINGRTREELLELRTDPEISTRMFEHFTAANGRHLRQHGIPPEPANLYLAHFLGAGTARKVLKADPNQRLEMIVGQKAVAANPSVMAGKTAGDLVAWAQRKLEGAAGFGEQPEVAGPPRPDALGDTIGRLLGRAEQRGQAPAYGIASSPASEVQAIDARLAVPEDLENETGLLEQVASFWGKDNLAVGIIPLAVASQVNARREFTDRRELSVDQVGELLTPAERLYASDFAGARSLADVQKIRADKRFQAVLNEKIASGPINSLVGTLFATATDPVNYIPFFGWARAAGAIRMGARVGAEIAVTETAAQALQEDRSAYESLAAVIMGGAVAGGVGAALSRGNRRVLVEEYATALKATAENTDELGASVGAAWVRPAEQADPTLTEAAPTLFGRAWGATIDMAERLGGETIGGAAARAARKVERGVARVNPSWEILKSPFPAARRYLLELTHPAALTKGNLKGVANPDNLETAIDAGRGQMHVVNVALDQFYRKARQPSLLQRVLPGGRKAFFEEVTRAQIAGRHADPVVMEAAEWLTKNVYEPLAKAADGVKLFDDLQVRFKTAPRVLDMARVSARSADFDKAVADWLQQKFPDFFDEDYRDLALETAASIRARYAGHPADRIPTGIALKVARKERNQEVIADDIPLEVIQDFLLMDAQALSNRFVRTMTADIATKKHFGELNIEATLEKEVRAEADKLKAAAKSDAERKAIENQAERNINVLKHIYRNVRGVQGPPTDPLYAGLTQAGAILRNYGFVRALGGVLFSSLGGDVGMTVFQHGFKRAFGTAAQEMINGFKGTRLAKRDLEMMGDALDWATSRHTNQLYDVGSRWETDTMLDSVERASRASAGLFAKATLLPAWNDWMKSFSSAATTTRILEAAEKVATGRGGQVSKFDRTQLARVGIGDAELAMIGKEAERWERSGTLIFANADAWQNSRAANKLRSAVVQMARNTILTPYAADAPMMFDREWGKLLFQFKKFTMAATGRILISGLQRRDMAAVNGIVALVAGGMMTAAVKDLVARGEIRDRDIDEWIFDGVDRSGALALLMEGNALSEKMVGRSLLGRQVPRYASRGRAGQVLGPTGGLLLDDLPDAWTAWADGDWDKRDALKLRRLAPGQNHFLIDQWLTSLAKG